MRAVSRLVQQSSNGSQGLAPLAELDGRPESVDVNSAMEAGHAEGSAQPVAMLPQRLPTFVVSKVHYAQLEGARHHCWNRLRIAFFAFIQLNARKSMDLLGLQGDDTIEVSVVRFL